MNCFGSFLVSPCGRKQVEILGLRRHRACARARACRLLPSLQTIMHRYHASLRAQALREVTVYDGGFDHDSPAVRWFWEIVESWGMEKQAKLLLFATGSARAPIGGLSKLSFKIQRNGGATDRLPTAATCFNTLLLPEYADKETMQRCLEIAVEECQGFGLK